MLVAPTAFLARRPGAAMTSIGLRRAGRSLRLLLSALAPLAACTAVLWIAALVVGRNDPLSVRFVQPTFDTLADEQVMRAATIPAQAVVLLGDSSCLLGIDVPRLRRAGLQAESLCTYAYSGPAGYASLLDRLLERDAAPKILVLVFSPHSFAREAWWDKYADALRLGLHAPPGRAGLDPGGLRLTLEYFRRIWMERVLYSPLPYAGGLYYGGQGQMVAEVRRNHGGAIDPASGLESRTLAEFRSREQADATPKVIPKESGYRPIPNERFMSSLDVLARSVARLGRARVFLLLTPFGEALYSETSAADYHLAARSIADRLGLPSEQILAGPDHLPNAYFTGSGHLNRWGRVVYTEGILGTLAATQSRRQ